MKPNNIDKALLARTLTLAPPGDLYVFAYGSLMWSPGFAYRRAEYGHVHGYRRRLAVFSHYYRGTPEAPGLVLGLDSSGSCCGVIYRIAAADKTNVIRYLFRREMFTDIYLPRYVRVSDGTVRRMALTFVVHKNSPQYAPPMPDTQAAAIIRHARGAGGTNADYIKKTAASLAQMTGQNNELARICRLLDE